MTDIGHKDPNERPGEQATTHAGKVLVAYLSRPGENYYYGDRTRLEVGNTKVVAAMIAELIDCDIHEIRAADPYPDAYDACVDRNKREQDDEARPEIANPLGDTDKYDVVLVGSRIWNVRTPMIMETFAGSHSFAGKTIHPFVTYAVSQLGSAERDYRRSLRGATMGDVLAVQGEKAKDARPEVAEWLDRIGLAAPPGDSGSLR